MQDGAWCAKNQKISVCGESKVFLAAGAEKFSRKNFLFFWKARGRPFKMKNNYYIYICNNNNNNKQQSIDIVCIIKPKTCFYLLGFSRTIVLFC